MKNTKYYYCDFNTHKVKTYYINKIDYNNEYICLCHSNNLDNIVLLIPFLKNIEMSFSISKVRTDKKKAYLDKYLKYDTSERFKKVFERIYPELII